MLKIDTCPICGAKDLKRVVGPYRGEYRGRPYEAPEVVYLQCGSCGEKLLDKEAMRQIESHRPKRAKRTA